jgi:hypothetical protein
MTYVAMRLVYILGAFGIPVGIWCAAFLPARLRARKWRDRLRRASASELAAECAKIARSLGFAASPAGEAICAERTWTERDLLSALDALYAEATHADRPGGSGGDSAAHMYCDVGFAEIAEVLRARLGLPKTAVTRHRQS